MSSFQSFSCSDCLQNESHKLPFQQLGVSTSHPLEIVYVDVWAPTPFMFIKDFYFYVIFIDYFSKYVWLYPLKHKSNVSIIFPQFKNLVEKQFNLNIKTIFTDNGGEFIKLRNYLVNHGISQITTLPHTPQQNGLIEHKYCQLIEITCYLLNHANIPKHFWCFTLQITAYLINHLLTPTLQHKSPFKVFQLMPKLS